MSITKEQLEEEKRHLKSILDVIRSKIEHSDLSIEDKMNAITEMKRYIWENNAMLDEAEIATSRYNVETSVDQTNDDIRRLEKLRKSMASPYFGRIDFEDDEGYLDKLYIGLNGIQQGTKLYVFDWRSPVASLFYNYGVGPSSYEAPIGTINGNTVLKRQYKINNGVLERCFESDMNIDDEYLQELLSSSSSEKMTNIVNTIQREQNEIIRNLKDKYLIVQGIAGSGKTSVALHRIAYLLYRENQLQSRNVLIFSPNDVFSTYISNVLPELGEDNVLQTTFSDFARSYISGYDSIESFTSFIDRFYREETNDKESFEVTKHKLSDEFKSEIDSFIERLKERISFNKSIIVDDKRFSSEELNNLFHGPYSKTPLLRRLDLIADHICDSCNINYERYGDSIKSKLLTALGSKTDIKVLYGELIGDKSFKNKKTLKYEDLIPLMYLYFELNGYPKDKNIKHIIIDEAQDYTLLQFEMLRKIFDNASFTILGDTHQTVNPYYMYDSLNNVNSVFNNEGKYIELLKSYRSSEEIIDYSNKILGINNACSIRKSNSIPVLLRDTTSENEIEQLVSDINYMKQQGMKKVAIITKDNDETKRLYEALKPYFDRMGKVEDSGRIVRGDVVVMPSYISKGLEFDGVIVYTEKDHRYKEKDKHLFYVVCTRAQHSLAVYNQEPVLKRTL